MKAVAAVCERRRNGKTRRLQTAAAKTSLRTERQKQTASAPALQLTGRDWYALIFGLLLGLAFVKFGNPVILDSKISAPRNVSEWLAFSWPPRWAGWLLIAAAIPGLMFAMANRPRWIAPKWLFVLPIAWFAWQLVSAAQTVDRELTALTIWHFAAVTLCYLLGSTVFRSERAMRLLLVGLLASFAWCTIRAVNQKFVDFPSEVRFLKENEQTGWTNLPPAVVAEMKLQSAIISTNGVDIANPVMLKKYERGRVFGTLVYPNALAGAVLLLFPIAIYLASAATRRLRTITRGAVILLTGFLGCGALFWTGSKSGWLIALMVAGIWLLTLRWPARLKWMVVGVVLVLGIGAFAVRFQNYFAAGATSVGARFDYWRAAVQTTVANPLTGTGPGTFQRPYERIKAPEAEMARLTHNDYLEQFSDSGIPGGLLYAVWVFGGLALIGRHLWKSASEERAGPSSKLPSRMTGLAFAIFLGCVGWFLQGFSEFGLYVPALAWTAFLFLGWLGQTDVIER